MSEHKVFTSWRAIRAQLLDDLASDSFRTMQSYAINSAGTGGARSVTYRSLAELKALIDWTDEEILKEEGPDYLARTYPRNMGRG